MSTATTAQYTRILNNVRNRCPGVLDTTTAYELFGVLDEFFKATNAWWEDIPVAVTTGVSSYDVSPTFGTPLQLLQLVDTQNTPTGATLVPTFDRPLATLVLDDVPTTAVSLTARLALTVVDPTDTDTYPICPDWVLVKYLSVIQSGVLAALMSQPAKPYTNAQLATFHQSKFNAGKSGARWEAMNGFLYGGQNWAFPQQFAGRSQRQ